MSVIRQLNIRDAEPIAAPVESLRPPKVGVLVDLALTPEAGGHVKCWQRLAEAAVAYGDRLDLTVHFNGSEQRQIDLSPSVRYVLLPPVFSTARLIRHVPDHTDLAPWHSRLAQLLAVVSRLEAGIEGTGLSRETGLTAGVDGRAIDGPPARPTPARSSAATVMFAWRSKPSRCAWHRSLRSDGRRGRRTQQEIRADTPFVGLIFRKRPSRRRPHGRGAAKYPVEGSVFPRDRPRARTRHRPVGSPGAGVPESRRLHAA